MYLLKEEIYTLIQILHLTEKDALRAAPNWKLSRGGTLRLIGVGTAGSLNVSECYKNTNICA